VTLSFPNPSRTFDSVRNAVRFVGYDGMFEIRFFVEAGALRGARAARSAPGAGEPLQLFDALRSGIYDAAREAYSNSRQSTYTLKAADLR